jgi:hypothetical protein
MEDQENQMNIELSEEIALGVYSNLAVITHSPAEVVCDFIARNAQRKGSFTHLNDPSKR